MPLSSPPALALEISSAPKPTSALPSPALSDTPPPATIFYSESEDEAASEFLLRVNRQQTDACRRRRRARLLGILGAGLALSLSSAGLGVLIFWALHLQSFE
ncbi:membrane protein US9 [Pteropodid alphaherpesvirus 1]|uniref:Membrane protein US9 n=1 Tax=Pteropodid alphaherpesvirus 1 TaxID=1343901 RepID=A0A060Q1X7_9ALPH|nr:membrane protein US9 [Pteropodid alphaherpesvirus 1]BAP00747.1 membrane protein US9 [Pteropodid alphaherpesvirus 1]